MCACVLNRFICVRFFAALWIVACQAPLSVKFSKQEYQGGLPCPPPRDLPYPGIKPMSLASPALFITCAPLGSPEPGAQPRRAVGLPGEKPWPCSSSPSAGTPKLQVFNLVPGCGWGTWDIDAAGHQGVSRRPCDLSAVAMNRGDIVSWEVG